MVYHILNIYTYARKFIINNKYNIESLRIIRLFFINICHAPKTNIFYYYDYKFKQFQNI